MLMEAVFGSLLYLVQLLCVSLSGRSWKELGVVDYCLCPLISWSMLLGTPNRFFKCDFHVGFYHNYKELFILIANFIYVV